LQALRLLFKKEKMKQSEYQEQCLIFEWAQAASGKYPELKYMFATLNGVRLPIGLAKKAKKQGNKRGVPDIILPVSTKKFKGLFIELKAGAGRASKEQRQYITFLTEQGYFADIRFGAKEAIDLIVDYLEGHL
jgi:hypothetical protein